MRLPALRSLLAAATAAALVAVAAPPAQADWVDPHAGHSHDYAPAGYADATTSTSKVVVPMTFPVIGPVSYSDTFLACRSGCARRHFGQDLMGPKMNRAVAVFNGVIHSIKRESTVGEGNYLTIKGDNGWSANYIHMNNDTPGTDDGRGTAKYFLAQGVYEGKRVFAGELLGWIGDSGNAESTGPHLHFELRKGDPWGGTVYNAFWSLNAARRLSRPTTSGPHPEGSYIKGCSTCSVWQITSGYRKLLRPDVAKQVAFDPRMAVTVTQGEARWYRQGKDVQLPGGRAYQGPDGKVWFVTGGYRHLVDDTALAALGVKASRVRTMTTEGLATVPVAPTGTVTPTGLFYGGALLRVPGSTTSYWYVKSGQRRLVTDSATLKSWGLVDADAITLPVDLDPLLLPPLGAPLLLRDGMLVKDAVGRRYVVSNGTKRGFLSYTVYEMYGYVPVLQQTAPGAAISRLPTGPRIGT